MDTSWMLFIFLNFLEAVYNKKRLLSSLGYLAPVEFLEKNEKVSAMQSAAQTI